MTHVCPWWLAYSFDNSLRRIFHKPEKMLAPYLKEGMSAIDIGCGMGFFSIGMAKLVGHSGHVISVDLQQEMLEVLKKRAEKARVADRIHFHRCNKNDIGIYEQVDFALAFWMVHEVRDPRELTKQVYSVLKPEGKFLLVEPKMHVSLHSFQEITTSVSEAGLRLCNYLSIPLSRAALFEKSTM